MKYDQRILEEMVKKASSFSDLVRLLGANPHSGGVRSHLKKKLREFGIDYSHFLGQAWNQGLRSCKRKTPNEILIKNTTKTRIKADLLRRALTELGIKEKCRECGLSETWNQLPIQLHVDHLNGEYWDNRQENLRYLCPNCHSQTSTWGIKNFR